LGCLQAGDVLLDFLGHPDQHFGRAAISLGFGEATALLGPGAHVGDYLGIVLTHIRRNSPRLISFLSLRLRAAFAAAL
jgi:hypothetical protein